MRHAVLATETPIAARGPTCEVAGNTRGTSRRPTTRASLQKGSAMRNYGIIGTLVVIILVIVVLRLLGVF